MAEPRSSRRRSGNTKVVKTGGRFLSSSVAAIGAAIVAVVVILIGVLFIFVLQDEDEGVPDELGAPPAASAPDVIPDLSDAGFMAQPDPSGEDPFIPESISHARALYASADGQSKIIVRVYIHPSTAEAEAGFNQVVDAYARAPLGTILDNPLLAGDPEGDPAFEESEGPDVGDTHEAFVTIRPDSQNNGVTTDVFREGRLIGVVQVLGSAASDHMELRADVAQRILDQYSSQS